MRSRILLVLVLVALSYGYAHPQPSIQIEGYGAKSRGAFPQPTLITNCNDSGDGSLRAALSGSHRWVRLASDLPCDTVTLRSNLYANGDYLTLDLQRLTITGRGGLLTSGRQHVHILGGRFVGLQGGDDQGTVGVGITVTRDSRDIAIHGVTAVNNQEGALTISDGAHYVTVSGSFFGGGTRLMLIHDLSRSSGKRPRWASVHGNVFAFGEERMPQAKHDAGMSPDTMLDFRHNAIIGWRSEGSLVWKGALANVVGNYYFNPGASDDLQRRAIYVGKTPSDRGRVYTSSNISGAGPAVSAYLNGLGSEDQPFPVPAVRARHACVAAYDALRTAGSRPFAEGSPEAKLLAKIDTPLPGCGGD